MPSGSVLIRFSIRTPFWPLSMSYGIFADSGTKLTFVSLDNYVGYHMLYRTSDRRKVLEAPNGFIANRELERIVQEGQTTDIPVVNPSWAERRDAVMAEGLRLKFSQSSMLREMLMRTGDQRIYDFSRERDLHWCYCGGYGANAHGRALEDLRARLLRGETLAPQLESA